jgi:opacity protein-like surface antigen
MTHGPLYDYNTNIALNGSKNDLNISYIMLNGVGYMKNNPMIWPYGGIGLGAAVINASGKDVLNDSYDRSETKFAWGIKGGVKIKTHSIVGIKLQAQLFSIVQASGGGFYTGTGGSGGYVSSFSTIYQFGFTGGISFDFERKK